jgi:hypothetical protein
MWMNEKFEKLKAGTIQYAVDLSSGENNKARSKENMERALDLLLTIHSARIVERLEAEKPDLSNHDGSFASLRFWQGYRKGLDQAIDIIEDNK